MKTTTIKFRLPFFICIIGHNTYLLPNREIFRRRRLLLRMANIFIQ